MTRLRLLCVLAIAGGLLGATLGPAQNTLGPKAEPNAKPKVQAAPPAASSQPAKKKQERIEIEWADYLKQEGDIYHLRGNVRFAREDMKLTCDQADYDEKADTAKGTGHLRITDPNTVITGDSIDADFGKELAIITGHVTIITQKKGNRPGGKPAEKVLEKPGKGVKPQGDGNKASATAAGTIADKRKPKAGEPERFDEYWEKKSTITCERLEYYYGDDVKKMIATPRVKAVQEDKTAWADTAVYEDIARMITLTGNVVISNTEKGDEMRCAKAVIWVDEDRVEAQGVTGFSLRKKKGEEPKPAPAPPVAPAPAPVAPAPPTAKP